MKFLKSDFLETKIAATKNSLLSVYYVNGGWTAKVKLIGRNRSEARRSSTQGLNLQIRISRIIFNDILYIAFCFNFAFLNVRKEI